MKIHKTAIENVLIIENTAFQDDRGAFSRIFCSQALKSVLGWRQIQQINHSLTRKSGAIRGLHYQTAPHAEMKIVRCLKGRVFDVAVDLREGSSSFLQWIAIELSPDTNKALVIPEGCAHGFQVLEPNSELLYFHTASYSPEYEGGVHFLDPLLDIRWPLSPTDISHRDQNHPFLTYRFPGLPV